MDKIHELFNGLSNQPRKEVDYKILWRWIKSTVKKFRKTALAYKEEKLKTEEFLRSKTPEKNKYQSLCKKLMEKNNIQNFPEFENFITTLVSNNAKNKEEMLKMKKLLMTSKNIKLEPINQYQM